MNDSWTLALIGGAIIGLSATILLLANGRVTGISGIFFNSFISKELEKLWRIKFLVGLLAGGVIASFFLEDAFTNTTETPTWAIITAGFLVGFGTKLGSGCTSGHGVCGISRLSRRSIVATVTFMAAGIITVAIIKAIGG